MKINKEFEWYTKKDDVYTYYFGIINVPEKWKLTAIAHEEDPDDYASGGFLFEVKFERHNVENIAYNVSYTTDSGETIWFECQLTTEQENGILKCILNDI